MRKKTFLAGKAFKLTGNQIQDFKNWCRLDEAPAHIMFSKVNIGDGREFSLYNSSHQLLAVEVMTGEEFIDEGVYEMFDGITPVNDFYKGRVVINKKKGQKNMSLSTLMRKALSKELRAMVDLGYLDSELSLTSTGNDWLLAELFDANKEELGKAASAELAERKKNKKSCK